MRLIMWIGSPWLATAVVWTVFVACIDSPAETLPAARVVATWDPTSCGDPHRVVIELEDDDGNQLSGSTRCTLGSIAIDAPHFGTYRGRIFAWLLEDKPVIRSITPLHLTVDEPIVRWFVETPR